MFRYAVWSEVCSGGQGVGRELDDGGAMSSELVRASGVAFAGEPLDVLAGGPVDESFGDPERGSTSGSMSLTTSVGCRGFGAARDVSKRSAMLGVLVQKMAAEAKLVI